MDAPKYAALQKIRDGKKTYAVTPRIPGGFIKPDDLIKIAEVAKKYNATLKMTSGQRMILLGLQPEDVDMVWEELGMEPAVLSSYSVKNVEMCPASFCKRSKQNSLKLGMKLEKEFYGVGMPNRTKIGVAGCKNACTSVHAKDVGVLADVDGYIITAGGSAGFHQRLSNIVAIGLSEDDAYILVKILLNYYNRHADMGEKLGFFIDRIGFSTFQEDVMDLFKKAKTSSKE